MIKVFLLFILIVTYTFAKADIDRKINSTSVQVKNVSKSYTSINRKMAKNAKDILNQKREIRKRKKLLSGLIRSLRKKELNYKEDLKRLSELKK